MADTPISVAFSRNHSKRLVFFIKEIAMEIFLLGGGILVIAVFGGFINDMV
jgi:hypothetical protein